MTRKVLTILSILVCAAIVFFTWLVPKVTAQLTSPMCNNATLQGLYAHHISGVRGTTPPYTPFTAVRTGEFQNGKVKGYGTLSLGGDVKDYKMEGTYNVKSDCTVIFENSIVSSDGKLSQSSKQFGVIVEHGKKVYLIQQTPGRIESGIYEKVGS